MSAGGWSPPPCSSSSVSLHQPGPSSSADRSSASSTTPPAASSPAPPSPPPACRPGRRAVDRHRRQRLLHLPEPAARHATTSAVELQGFKKSTQTGVTARRGRHADDRRVAADRRPRRGDHGQAESTPLQTDVALRKTVESKDIEQLSFSGRNPIGVAGLKAGVIGGSFNNYGFSDLGNGGFNINGSRTDENNITVDGATAIRTRSLGRHHRHPERRRDPGSPGADRRLHARVRPRERRPDPHGHQERQQPLQRQRLVLPTATTRCRPTPGRATAARTRSRTAARRRSTTSSTATRSAARSRRRCSRTSCSSSARRSGSTSSQVQTQRSDGADREDAPAATSASCSTRTTASSAAPRSIIDPPTGQPFPGNIIPSDRLSRRTAWRC